MASLSFTLTMRGRNVAKKLCKCLSESNNIHTIVTDRILTLIPDGPEGEHVGGLGEGEVPAAASAASATLAVAVGGVDAQALHDLRRQVAQPALGDRHGLPAKRNENVVI